MATILIVDDRPMNRQFLLTLLGYSHRVLDASDGAEALEVARAQRPDLIITDILMPTMDGYELVLGLKEDPILAKIPIIFYSATYSTPEAELLAKSCGVNEVLRKPCEPQEILAAVDRALGASPPEARSPAEPSVGAAAAGRELERVGNQGAAYLNELRAASAMFDEVFVRGSDLAGVRERVRGISEKLSGHVSDLQRFTSRLASLIEISMDTLSETDPARMVEKLFSTACKILGSSCAAVGVLGETDPKLKLLFARGVDPAIFDRNPQSGISGRLMRERGFLLWHDGDAGRPVDEFPPGHPPVHSFLGGPIVSSDEVHGWIYFAKLPGEEPFRGEDERIGATLAAMLALLYEHVMLYDVIQHHAARLQIEAAERKRADLATRESEAKFRELIEQASDGIFVSDAQGNFKLVNSRFCEMLEYGGQELLRINVADTYVDAEKAVLAHRLASLGEVGSRLFERTIQRKDGSQFPVEVSIRRLSSGLNQGIVRDITERKEAARALVESKERFRQVAENIRDVFFLIDLRTGGLLYVSPAYEEVWGRSCDSLYAKSESWIESIHPDDRDRIIQKFVEQRATGRFDDEYRIVRPSGDVRWIRARTFSIRDESGNPYRSAGVAEDITERKRAADELRESERRFSDVLGKVKLVSLMLDREARITYCNDYLLRLTDWKREEVLGRDWFELFIPPDLSEMKGVFADLIADLPKAWHHENEILTRSGARRLVRWNNSVLRSVAGEVIGTASIGEDITEQKQAEIKIRSLNRVYAVLSGVNALLVRVRDREELFRETCRIAVEDGNFGMAWIGAFDPATLDVTPVAWKGMDEGGASMKASARSDIPEGQGMVGRAIRGKTPVITNDINADPGAGGPRRDEALRKGLHSIIAMPLIVEDEVAATLTLFAKERNFFSEDEMKLLTELAGDISFALDHIGKEEKLNYLAYYDALTGLANATLFHDRVDQYVHDAGRVQRKLAVLLIDVDRFKTINDTLGRHVGDEILKQTAKRLLRYCRDQSHLARVSADRFALVMPDVETEQEVGRRTEETLRACFGEPYGIDDNELRIAAKVGIALFPNDGADAETLFKNAEAALKKAKASGERYLFYTQQMTERIAEELALESKLRQALERLEFVLHYQPKFDTQTKRIEGVEALIRWRSPELGLVPPMEFIPLLEETGLIFEVGAWALRQAAFDYRRWQKLGLSAPRVAVNVSAFQLRRRDFVESVQNVLGEGTGAAAIDLELTESLIMEDVRASTEKLQALQLLGVEIAIDDFGTGYSSLAYLAKLPVQTLKIDRSFIITMLGDPATMTLVSTIISMAHSLQLKVVAEGVDSNEQAAELKRLGCDQLQGYLFSKPVSFDQMTVLLGPRA